MKKSSITSGGATEASFRTTKEMFWKKKQKQQNTQKMF